MQSLPLFVEPYWRSSVKLPEFPSLNEDIHVDVAIIGGGISGITTAYLLTKAGSKVALIEADQLLNGTTGHTTAKVTAQHDLIYDELIHHLGTEKAQLYYEACTEAMRWIQTIIHEQNIDCDWKEEDAYIYTHSSSSIQKLINECKAYEKLGIKGGLVEDLPLPLPSKAALVMKQQAQFHPLKYLTHLIEEITQSGGLIYEQTPAKDVEKGNTLTVITRNNKRITCQHLAVCSHFPFYDGGFYFSRMYAERSYVLGVQIEGDYPGGMYLSADEPKRSIRYVTTINGEKLLLVSGENHKTGQGVPTIQHYEALQSFASDMFPVTSIPYRWSAQDLTTLDKVPYIGAMTAHTPNIYVATGYRKWGMTNGTVAGLLLTDLITGRENRYHHLYTPSRFYADPSVKHFITQNLDVAKHLIEGKIEPVIRTPQDLANGEGSVVLVNGKRAGAYKDENGSLFLVDTTCTHMGCELEWNSGDRTWDCPCHGSRFSVCGDVVEGPAQQPLTKISEEALD
ncbi:FAD-dependent oxidoreductase [Anoxybacillus rupiensis]|uniref:FAD-dependent oxidoreductase n=1 Tax=Anoxybacteroides rupiense TaxID=311460 RepID=A0ABT5W3U3_9BACL|nr:FAD-dependent oxidoreductase [Anoxybacillus rupiensis]MBS2772350.1 FAD-dependent oxidoreductase [Anoxybacillus rupiensis]MDE8563962.1 FAD-dependent oxidoreductase [Anoxybacillus rupiensis]